MKNNIINSILTTDRLERHKISAEYDKAFDTMGWLEKIPFLSFPSYWKLKILPPFFGAIIRFSIRTDKMAEQELISVYLDGYDLLGCNFSPYWEVYPIENKDERFVLTNTEKMLQTIDNEIKRLEAI